MQFILLVTVKAGNQTAESMNISLATSGSCDTIRNPELWVPWELLQQTALCIISHIAVIRYCMHRPQENSTKVRCGSTADKEPKREEREHRHLWDLWGGEEKEKPSTWQPVPMVFHTALKSRSTSPGENLHLLPNRLSNPWAEVWACWWL